jgi:hypothetical protein
MTSRKRYSYTAMGLILAMLAVFLPTPVPVYANPVVSIAPAPAGETLSGDYTVTVNGSNVPVYRAKASAHAGGDYSFAYFDFSGTVNVSVTASGGRSASNAIIQPVSLNIQPTRSGSTVSFPLSQPANMSIELNGKDRPLLLFANPLQVSPPNPGDSNVIYFGPGIHTPQMVGNNGVINLTSNKTLYLAPGAVVQAAVIAKGNNIKIRGRGILDQNPWQHWAGPAGHVISIQQSTNFSIEGIIVRGAWSWTIHALESDGIVVDNVKQANSRWANDDGFDPVNSKNIVIRNSFFRNDDDNIAMKGQHSRFDLAVNNVLIENSTFWADTARNVLIGDESQALEFSDITVRNVDIIHYSEPAIALRPGSDVPIKRVRFENIRISGPGKPGFPLIELNPSVNEYTNPPTPGLIDNVVFKNVFVHGQGDLHYGLGRIVAKGTDAAHMVKNVTFDNFYRYGALTTASSNGVQVGPHTSGITFTSTSSVTPPPSVAPPLGWSAAGDYSGVQGSQHWSYQVHNNGQYTNMTYSGSTWNGSSSSYITSTRMHPGSGNNDAARSWQAPSAMEVNLSGRVYKTDTAGGDGVVVSIKKNNTTIWGPHTIAYNNSTGLTYNVNTQVAAGDTLRFIVNQGAANNWNDATYFSPAIQVLSGQQSSWKASTGFSGTQGANGWSYQQLSGSTYSNLSWGSTSWTGSGGIYIDPSKQHPGSSQDAVRKWTAPTAANVQISGQVYKTDTGGGDGVVVSIRKNGTTIWGPHTIAYNDSVGLSYNVQTSVAAGDALYFIINRGAANNWNDATHFDPLITAVSPPSWKASTDFSGTQGANNWSYQQLSGSTYSNLSWGSSSWSGTGGLYIDSTKQHPGTGHDAVRKWTAPSAATVSVSGQVYKTDTGGGDGVVVSIRKNGTTIWGPHTIAYNDSVGLSYNVQTSVAAGDALYFIVNRGAANNWNDATHFDPAIAVVP